MEEKIIHFQIGITTNEMKYVLNYLFFYIPQVENGAAEMGEIVCRLCKERFPSKKERTTHTVNCKKIQKCSSCNVSVSEFKYLRSFNVHRRNCENGQLRCAHCGRNDFKKKGGRSADKLLNNHYSKCKKKKVPCNKCNKRLCNLVELAKHIQSSHPHFDCDICGAYCQTEETLRKHKKQEHNE